MEPLVHGKEGILWVCRLEKAKKKKIDSTPIWDPPLAILIWDPGDRI